MLNKTRQISFYIPVVDAEADFDAAATGVTYRMLENACVALITPKPNNGGRRLPRQLIVNRGQIGSRTATFDLALFSLLSAGAKSNCNGHYLA